MHLRKKRTPSDIPADRIDLYTTSNKNTWNRAIPLAPLQVFRLRFSVYLTRRLQQKSTWERAVLRTERLALPSATFFLSSGPPIQKNVTVHSLECFQRVLLMGSTKNHTSLGDATYRKLLQITHLEPFKPVNGYKYVCHRQNTSSSI